MRRFLGLLLPGLAVVVCFAMTAAASDTIVFSNAENSYGGYGTALYYGTLNGTSTSFICDDATHDIGQGSTWQANAWTLSQVTTQGNGAFAGGSAPYATASGDAPNVVGGGPSAMNVAESYSAVAYLADLLLTGQDSSYANQIQYAIWEIMDHPPAGPGDNSFENGLAMSDTGYWAYQGYLNDTYTNPYIVFYSPDGNTITSGPYTGDTPQEFIGLTPTPEPASMILLGTFLCLSSWLLGKKRLLG
jgi:hypothetical protein